MNLEDKKSLCSLGIGVSVVTFIASLLIQLVVLPYLFPSQILPNGTFAAFDSQFEYAAAVEFANKVRNGEQAWFIHQGLHFVSSLLGTLYLFLPEAPWVFSIVTASFHALAACVLAYMLRIVFGFAMPEALFGSLLFAFFPSTFSWTTQIGRDTFAIAGNFLFILGWLLAFRCLRIHWNSRHLLGFFLCILCGSTLAWAARYQSARVHLLFSALFLVGFVILAAKQHRLGANRWLILALLICTVWTKLALPAGTVHWMPPNYMVHQAMGIDDGFWKPSPWLPKYLDDRFKEIARFRQGFIIEDAHDASTIDANPHDFHNALDIILYLPRALSVGLFAPFPKHWIGDSKANFPLFRLLSGGEMLVTYLLIPFFLWAWYRHRRLPEMWALLAFTLGNTLILSLVNINLGTLYRLRYGYLMLLIGVAAATAVSAYRQIKTSKVKLTMATAT